MWRSWFIRQPLDDVRNYFGESVAVYFAWLGHYTKWLIYSTIVGIIIFIIQETVGRDKGAEIVFAIFLAFWATLFLESWKRRNSELALKWNMLDYERQEKTRPEFKGEDKSGVWVNGVFIPLSAEEGGKKQKIPTTTYFNPFVRILRIIAGLPLIFGILICCLAATLGVIVCRIAFQQINVNLSVVSSIINAIAIIILNVIYDKIALILTNWENHRTDTEYEDALITKTFAFQFVNSYVSLFYIAYFKSWTVVFNDSYFQDHCKYGNNDCITELMVQLATILATNIFIGQAQEVGVPYILSLIKTRGEKQAAAKLEDPNLSKEELKLEAKKYIYLKLKFKVIMILGVVFSKNTTKWLFNMVMLHYLLLHSLLLHF